MSASVSSPDRVPAEGPRAVRRDPVVAAGSRGAWNEWARRLLATARGRLAAVPLVLVAAFAFEAWALWFFGELANAVSSGYVPVIDAAVLSWLQERASPLWDRAAVIASFIGAELILPLLVLCGGLFAYQRRWGALLSLVVITIGSQHLDTVLKGSFQRVRPNPLPSPLHDILPAQTFSFPSGHAMVAAAFYLFLAYVAWRLLPPVWGRLCAALLGLVILFVGLSRLYLGVHYLTDVLAGFAAGAGWTIATVVAGHLLALPRRRRALSAGRSASSR
ncbi:MAG TPA: phosphatase PAP2 family protein [Chloroflexota bacterium]|nr:phosphatase PAP2 family protein [Chloroflexota bacterium]